MPRLEDLVAVLGDPVRPLPGPASRERLIPGFRQAFFEDPLATGVSTEGGLPAWREAAVLILLYPDERGEPAFPLIRRPEGAGSHAGQIALPGGAREPGESLADCALRECSEELGVAASGLRLLRELTALPVPPSRFLVRPFIAWAASKPDWHPAAAEVARVLEIEVGSLLEPASLGEYEADFGGAAWRVPYFALAGERVWGATAMILAEFAALIGRAPGS